MSQTERDVVGTLSDMQVAADLLHRRQQQQKEQQAADALKTMGAAAVLVGSHRTREPEWCAPTNQELGKGIPANFQVRVGHRKNGKPYRTYRSPAGTLYRSVVEVLRSLDDSSSSSDSDTSSSEDEAMCEDDDDIMEYTITLRISVNDDASKRDRVYVPMTTVGQVIEDVLPGATLFYKGVGQPKEERLQCMGEHMVPDGVYEVNLRNRPSLHTFVFNFNEH